MLTQLFQNAGEFEFGPYVFAPADAIDQDLDVVLVAHGADENDAATWSSDWCALVTSGASEMLSQMWKAFPCAATMSLLVQRFLLVDMIARTLLAERHASPADERPVVPDMPLCERAWPADLNERIAAKLAELGEAPLAAELQADPVRFWWAYSEGWAQATANTAAYTIDSEYRVVASLLTNARQSIGSFSRAPRLKATYDGQAVQLPVGYRLSVPDVAVQVRDESKELGKVRILLFPTESYRLGPKPLDIEVASPDVQLDVQRLVRTFDRVSGVHLSETRNAQSAFNLKIVGTYGGNAVELMFQRAPRSAWSVLSR